MAPPLLLLQDIALTLGTAPLLAGAELSVGPGERLCLVGRNGSGKSTLLQIAAGLLAADAGHALPAARRHRALSAAGAGPLGLRHHAAPMSRPGWARATIRTARAACWSSSA